MDDVQSHRNFCDISVEKFILESTLVGEVFHCGGERYNSVRERYNTAE